jgi:K+-sensing histidine kinase KdpD
MKAFQSLLSRLKHFGRHVRSLKHGLTRDAKAATCSAWPDGAERMQVKFGGTRILARTVLYPLACVALTTGLMAVALRYTALEFASIVYLIPVLISAIRWGFVSATVSVFASAAVADFLFIPPFYSLTISDPRQVVELLLFLFVALVTSDLAARLRKEVDTLHRREREIQNLYEFSRRLALCSTAEDLLKAIQDYLSVHLSCKAHLIRLASLHAGDGGMEDEMVPQLIARQAKEMIAAQELGSRLVTEPATNSLWALKHITTMTAEHGVLAVNLGKPRDAGADKLNDRIDALLLEAIATLTRIDAAAALAKSNMRLESEILRTALVGTASHELRSPVAAILGTTSVLDQMLALQGDEKVRSLVDGMHLEAKRLEGDIQIRPISSLPRSGSARTASPPISSASTLTRN